MKIRGYRQVFIIFASVWFSASAQQASQGNSLPDAPSPRQAPRPNPDAGIYHSGDGVVEPKIVYQVEPEIPEAARKVIGKRACSVYLVVGTDGHTSNIHVVASKQVVRKEFDPRSCEPETVNAVKNYRFKPATIQNKPVPFEMTIELNYVVN